MNKIRQYWVALRNGCIRVFTPTLPPDADNVRHNRSLWNTYASTWDRQSIYLEKDPNRREEHIHVLGDEWGTPTDLDEVFRDFFEENLSRETVAVEIGVGGGRIAKRVAPLVKTLWAFDIAPAMLAKARQALSGQDNVQLVQLEDTRLPDHLVGQVDFIYSFDVFVHLDLHTLYRYLVDMARVIKPDGRILIHTSNLSATEGWNRFSSQSAYSVAGHYFICPELLHILVEHAGLRLVKESQERADNFYYARDYVCLLARK